MTFDRRSDAMDLRGRALAWGAALFVLFSSACDRIGTPESRIADQLEEIGRGDYAFAVEDCGVVEVKEARFSHLIFVKEVDRIVAVARVDAEAVFEGETRVSYLGRERIPFRFRRASLELAEGPLPALQSAVAHLCRRRPTGTSAFEGTARGDRGLISVSAENAPTGAESRAFSDVKRWSIRVDRDCAEILEERADGRERIVLEPQGLDLLPSAAASCAEVRHRALSGIAAR